MDSTLDVAERTLIIRAANSVGLSLSDFARRSALLLAEAVTERGHAALAGLPVVARPVGKEQETS
jgi:uncharacterized protein (DUF1778 family)